MKNIFRCYIGSSETTREASVFNFSSVLFNQKSSKKEIKDKTVFFEWFIGFIEGDGSFAIKKFPTDKNSENTRPYFIINQKDPKVLYKIKKKVGFGKVTFIPETEKNNAYHRYTVAKLEHIEWLIRFFNGNLLLTKVQNRFLEWVKCFNNLQALSNRPLLKFTPFLKEAEDRVSLKSGWLAGFIDAEGGFYGALSKNKRFKTGYRERWKFYITQKYERWLLFRIGELVEETAWKVLGFPSRPPSWKSSKHVMDLKKQANIYRLEIHRAESLKVLIDYLDSYRLLSKQDLVFTRWKRSILGKDGYRAQALLSKKGMRRYLRIFASIGAIHNRVSKNDEER